MLLVAKVIFRMYSYGQFFVCFNFSFLNSYRFIGTCGENV